MNAFIMKSWGAFLAAFVGSLLALVLIPLLTIAWQQTYELYDKYKPPVSAKLATYEYDVEGRLLVRFYVTRHENCSLLKMQGYTGPNPTSMQPSTMRRLDGEDPASYPVGITVLSNTWVMSPVYGAHVRVQGYYECNSRVVRPVLLIENLEPRN